MFGLGLVEMGLTVLLAIVALLAGFVHCVDEQTPTDSRKWLRWLDRIGLAAFGRQLSRIHGTGWSFDGPEATLSADAGGKSIVGTHYAGPKWESNSGGTVRGTVLESCTVDPNAIAWLLLSAVSEGPGIFHRVTHIQRVNTAGGKAPSYSGQMGEVARIPYTTEYLFYRAN